MDSRRIGDRRETEEAGQHTPGHGQESSPLRKFGFSNNIFIRQRIPELLERNYVIKSVPDCTSLSPHLSTSHRLINNQFLWRGISQIQVQELGNDETAVCLDAAKESTNLLVFMTSSGRRRDRRWGYQERLC
ncbi:hypothetical protein PoB_001254600 [Plakobranchus ocellatus]|uniref:Uncharacterized protein n=1 Tax=Plakobranchus ocellatus TaxID=259542 RepID=A0AAV3YRU0_9GAST|nr:hypothetical protein PoB_001254600 [Plakobranchus ocellatus]